MQLSLFDERDLAEITSPEYPGERLVVCCNPLLAPTGLTRGAVLGRRKMAKHFRLSITDNELVFTRDEAAIAAEARLDGIYVLRTSLSPEQLDTAGTVSAYKSLAHVERAFR